MTYVLLTAFVSTLLLSSCAISPASTNRSESSSSLINRNLAETNHLPNRETASSCQPLQRITVSKDSLAPRFLSKEDGRTFVPRGANYTRLDKNQYHITFDPTSYNSFQAERALSAMQSLGYNYARVFLSSRFVDDGFGKTSPGVDGRWLNNIADFLSRASCHKIHVVLSGAWLPANYNSIAYGEPPPPQLSGVNNLYLNPTMIKAQSIFWKDVLGGLKNISAKGLSTILAIDVINEAALSLGDLPFSKREGIVTFWKANFNMASANDRQRLADTSAIQFIERLRNAIHEVDPEMLVSMSTFTPKAVGHPGYDGVKVPGAGQDLRYPMRPLALAQAGVVDYLDIHIYPSNSYSLDADFLSAELSPKLKTKIPLIMGEYGATKNAVASHQNFITLAREQLLLSCRYGFVGWGQWTWDTSEQIPAFWTALDGNGAVGLALSPKSWPSICRP